MFDAASATRSASLAALTDVVRALESVATPDAADEALDVIAMCERIDATTAALRARQTAAYDVLRRDEQRAAGVRDAEVGAGIAHDVALARRCSPHRARRYLNFSRMLTRELPATFAALAAGVTSEWRAMLVAQETVWLSAEHRREVDRLVAPLLGTLGDRTVEAEARRQACRLDPQGFRDRIARAEKDRHVSLRPAPDCMARLSALLPVAAGVAALAALTGAADSLAAAGDERSRGQAMADTLVQRLTGQTSAEAVPIMVNVIVPGDGLIPDDLVGGGLADNNDGTEDAAEVPGYGPVPAWFARRLATAPAAPVRWRRLFTDRAGRLVTMETAQRGFTDAQREFIKLRDQTCATPYCDAPIRHIDHITPVSRGGPTSLDNAQGLCAACNYAKDAARKQSRSAAFAQARFRIVHEPRLLSSA